jgi:hypothetical protein
VLGIWHQSSFLAHRSPVSSPPWDDCDSGIDSDRVGRESCTGQLSPALETITRPATAAIDLPTRISSAVRTRVSVVVNRKE